VLAILDDWDDEIGDWKTSGAEWARRLGVSPSTIHMLRRGETWEHLKHPNQGRRRRDRANGSNGDAGEALTRSNGTRRNGGRSERVN
jgi:hypothetical protein